MPKCSSLGGLPPALPSAKSQPILCKLCDMLGVFRPEPMQETGYGFEYMVMEVPTSRQDSSEINPVRTAKRTRPGMSKIFKPSINLARWYSTVLSLSFRIEPMALVV